MSLKTRIIPCLDVKDGRVVKGVQFVDLVDAGDPVEAAIAYDAAGADELCFLDITASHEGRDTIFDFTSADKIDLSVIDAKSNDPGNDAFRFIGTKGFSGKSGELRYKKMASDTYIYGDINGDKARKADHWDMGERIRAIDQGPDGSIYLLEDKGRLLRLDPK